MPMETSIPPSEPKKADEPPKRKRAQSMADSKDGFDFKPQSDTAPAPKRSRNDGNDGNDAQVPAGQPSTELQTRQAGTVARAIMANEPLIHAFPKALAGLRCHLVAVSQSDPAHLETLIEGRSAQITQLEEELLLLGGEMDAAWQKHMSCMRTTTTEEFDEICEAMKEMKRRYAGLEEEIQAAKKAQEDATFALETEKKIQSLLDDIDANHQRRI